MRSRPDATLSRLIPITCLLFILLVALWPAAPVRGQDGADVASPISQRLAELYANDLPAPVAVKPGRPEGLLDLTAVWVPESEVKSDTGVAQPDRPVAWLIVRMRLADDWHTYPGFAQTGAAPTFLDAQADSVPPGFRVGAFLPASPQSQEELPGASLIVLRGDVLWLAPISADESATQLPPETELRGTIEALLCSEGGGGICFPYQDSWSAVAGREEDLSALIQARDINEQSQMRAPGVSGDGSGSLTTPGSDPRKAMVPFSPIILLYALLGGLILNVMPCVLPVIGLKIISFFQQAGQSRAKAFTLNVWYTVGILLVFLTLALMSVGLSYLFTYGLFQIIMGAIVFTMALNLMGLWEITLPAFLGGRRSSELTEREGPVAAVFKGVITTLLAIPCGAPLLSPALVWSDSMIQQGRTPLVVLVYLVIGFGMALPYLILGAFPELLRFLPKPGKWMETFRSVMGFVLLLAVVWILYSMPIELVLPMVTFLFALWFACWLLGYVGLAAESGERRRAKIIGLAVVLITLYFSFNIPGLDNKWTLENAFRGKLTRWAIRAEQEGKLAQDGWVLFSQDQFEKDLRAGKTVMIDFTADWCMNCKVLEATVLKSSEILALVKQRGIVTMTADWTNQNGDSEQIQAINNLLDRYGGRQVPVVMIFQPSAPDSPVVLRGVFSKSRLVEELEKIH
ncbi:MAG: thioredoxin family protein [Planctomycetia bacterium]|nr:thioredoxin family protein [Planctomycetia bacterium]